MANTYWRSLPIFMSTYALDSMLVHIQGSIVFTWKQPYEKPENPKKWNFSCHCFFYHFVLSHGQDVWSHDINFSLLRRSFETWMERQKTKSLEWCCQQCSSSVPALACSMLLKQSSVPHQKVTVTTNTIIECFIAGKTLNFRDTTDTVWHCHNLRH